MISVSRVSRRGLRHLAQMVIGAAYRLQPAPPPGVNLVGDRDIEWSWILAHMKNGPGIALDLGPGSSLFLSVCAAERGYDVIALDKERHTYSFVHEKIALKCGDILTEEFDPSTFDLMICCSTIEHVGLSRRYHTPIAVPDGDLAAMKILWRAIKGDGTLLLTIPVGLDSEFAPRHRIYGERRLPVLLSGWQVLKERYWVKQLSDQWHQVPMQEALTREGSKYHYGLGCLVLKKVVS